MVYCKRQSAIFKVLQKIAFFQTVFFNYYDTIFNIKIMSENENGDSGVVRAIAKFTFSGKNNDEV